MAGMLVGHPHVHPCGVHTACECQQHLCACRAYHFPPIMSCCRCFSMEMLQGAKATNKEAVLLALAAKSFSAGSTIVFCGTKQTTHRIHLLFQLLGLPSSAELHGNLTQTQRLQSLELFRQVSP